MSAVAVWQASTLQSLRASSISRRASLPACMYVTPSRAARRLTADTGMVAVTRRSEITDCTATPSAFIFPMTEASLIWMNASIVASALSADFTPIGDEVLSISISVVLGDSFCADTVPAASSSANKI